MSLTSILKQLTPPLIWSVAKRARRVTLPAVTEWEYMSEVWPTAQGSAIQGWNVPEVLEAYKTKWPTFLDGLNGAKPLTLSPEAMRPTDVSPVFHNTAMCFGYSLARAAHMKTSLSFLDWGGGIGHYAMMAQTLLPQVELDYHCKDLPLMAEYGQRLLPTAHFYSDEACLTRSYDFVMASSSLHYSPEWSQLLRKLALAAAEYLYITRLPVVHNSGSFTFVQRPYAYGYNTEYCGWCLNRDEFVGHASKADLTLVREFVTGEAPFITNAPDQCEYRGYLFRRSHGASSGS
jgi:putative methyltransferase (TIGR04325 family)